jgi:iron complex outermembrane receptor protein
MKNVNSTRTRSRQALRATPVAAAVAALLCTSEMALAQQAAGTQTITVTGIRRGIESAIAIKQNADGVVEAISAEDIGKLPDTTIAESLARLPGVTTQRTKSGAASTVSIRGLGPDFNGYLLNGREQTSVGDSRAVDLSVYPAELISGATVYKTGDALLMTAGLAGTIDNKLVDPLSFPSRVLAANAQDITTGKGLPVEGKGKRYSLTYIDQFADRTLGLAMGYVKADGTTNELGSGGWGDATVQATTTAGQVLQGVKVLTFGGGLDNYKNRRVKDEREGFVGILAYRPNKSFRSQVDLYYGKILTEAKETRLQGGLGGPITNATVVNGVATKGTFQLGAGPNGLINRIESVFDDDTIKSIGWRTEWAVTPGLSATLDVSSNSAKRIERDIEAYSGVNTGADTLTFDVTNGTVPQLTLGRPLDYTNPATIKIRDQTGWSGVNYADGTPVPQAGYSKGPTITDKVNAVRLDFRKDLASNGYFTDVAFGGNYTKRTKDRVTDEGLIVSSDAVGRSPIDFPGGAYVESNVGGTGLNTLTFDPRADLWPGARIQRKYNDDILSKTWGVQEKVLTLFAKLNVDTQIGSLPVRGNVGLQLVNTDQSSQGYQAQVGSGVTLTNPAGGLVSAGTKYTDVLPSVNLSSDLGSGNVLRLGLGQQIARNNLTDMRNSFAASVNTNTNSGPLGIFIGSAGNPNLKPMKAQAFDLSFEKYFGNKGYLGAAVFYKKLETYVTSTTTINYDFTTYAQSLGLAIPAGGARGIFTQPTNGSGGNVSGVELSASVPFNLVANFLDGFGLTASYSDTQSSISLPNLIGLNPNQTVPTTGTMQLPGLSKTNTKLMLYFEKYGFSAFVAQNERSRYVGSVANDSIGGYPTLKYISKQTWVSAQVGYEFQEGRLKGLGLRVEGNNLNKPTYTQERLDGSIESQNKTGASIAMKISYKLP